MSEITLHRPLPGNVLEMRINRTLHGRSVHRKANVSGHNVIRFYTSPGKNDAVDLFCPAGTEVYATHDAKITRRDPDNQGVDCLYLDGRVGPHHVLTVLAHLHIKPAISRGDQVKAGQVVGYVGKRLRDPHLHLEVLIDGEPIHGKTAQEYVQRLAGVLDSE